MKKILVFLIIVALIAVCWMLFFGEFDFDQAESNLLDSNYTVSNITGNKLVSDGILTGSLAKYASSIGGVMVALSVDSQQLTNSQVLVALEVTDISIVADLAELLTSDDTAELLDDIDIDALTDMADSYPAVAELITELSVLDEEQAEQLLDSLSYSIVGSTLLIGTSSAMALVK